MAYSNEMDYITIASTGNATDFGDLTVNRRSGSACSNGSRGIAMGGEKSGGVEDTIDYWTFASAANAVEFCNLTDATGHCYAAASDGTKGVLAGKGSIAGQPAPALVDTIEYVNISSTGNVTDFGNLTAARSPSSAASNGTRMVTFGGSEDASPASVDTMEYVTFASLGNAADFGNLVEAMSNGSAGAGDGTKGISAGGQGSGGAAANDYIQYVNIASLGNTTDFGNLSDSRYYNTGFGDGTKFVSAGGLKTSSYKNIIEYVNFASTGNGTDFGDLNTSPIGAMGASGD